MPGRSPSISKEQRRMYELETLNVLSDSPVALNISEICSKSLTLSGLSSQRMARVLAELVNMGLVRKTHSKSQGRMIYMAVSQLEEQGITLSSE